MNFKDLMLALFFTLCCAASLSAQKIALQEISLYLMNFLRLFFICPLIFFFKKPEKIFPLVIGGLFWNVLNCLFIGFALNEGASIAVSSVLIQTNTFFAILFSYWLFNEKIYLRNLIGILISVIGLFMLIGKNFFNDIQSKDLLFLLIASCCWGLGFNILKKYKVGKSIDDVVWLSAISTLPFLAMTYVADAKIFQYEYLLSISSQTFICILIAGFFSSFLATWIWLRLAQKYPAATLMPVIFFLPIISGIIAWLTLGELPSVQTSMALIVMMFGIAISQGWFKKINQQL